MRCGMREYLKKKARGGAFRDFLLKTGADYVEDDVLGVYEMPKKVGQHRAAVRLSVAGHFQIGYIRDDKFSSGPQLCFEEECRWLSVTLAKISKWNGWKKP
jgi:hypothetical protein